MARKKEKKKTAAAKKKLRGGPRRLNRERLERDLEKGLEDTFPASDPVAVTEPVVDVVKGNQKN